MPWHQQALGIPDTKLKWHVGENFTTSTTVWGKKKTNLQTSQLLKIFNASANGPKGHRVNAETVIQENILKFSKTC